MTRRIALAEIALGVEGVALMRHLFDADRTTVEERLGDIRRFVDDRDQPPLSLALEFPERSVTEGYAEWAASYDTMPNGLIDAEETVLKELLAELAPGRALDAACGTGRITKLLVAGGHDVIGVDGSAEMLGFARQRLPEVTFKAGTLEALPAADGEFDLVTCGLALAHFEHLIAPVAELARVTRPGGRIVITDIHPIGVVFAGHAAYQAADGSWGFVRNHFHTHGTYLDAFGKSRLVVRRCLEPTHTEATADLLPSAMVAPEATRQALVGLPIALIWDLERGA